MLQELNGERTVHSQGVIKQQINIEHAKTFHAQQMLRTIDITSR